MRRTREWVALAIMASSAACGGGAVEPPGTLGELGEGTFRYTCVQTGDAVCNQSTAVDAFEVQGHLGIAGQAPAAVAVGARFGLSYSGDTKTEDGELLLIETQPARPDEVSTVGGFVIHSPGVHAFLARSPKGIVADFIHLTALQVGALDVWVDERRVQAFTIQVGAEEVLAVVPQDGTGISLAGALPYSWTVEGPSIAIDSIDSFGAPSSSVELNDDEIRVYGLAEGIATITVERGGLSKVIEVTVEPEVTP
jgi:hypothetical protein